MSKVRVIDVIAEFWADVHALPEKESIDKIIRELDINLLGGHFEFCDALLATADCDLLTLEQLLAVLTATRYWKRRLKNRGAVEEKAKEVAYRKYSAAAAERLLAAKI